MEDKCVACGKTVPEGRMLCPSCEDNEPSFNTVKITVLLNRIIDVKNFINLVSKCNDDVTIGSGRVKVDAKSIMGVFSLDLSKPLKVEFYGDIPYEVRKGMKEFIVD